MINSMNSTDYKLKRDRVYAFFKGLGSFYVTETQQGNKLLKVRVVEQYMPERIDRRVSTLDIPLQIDGQRYWISRFKTMDLHNNKEISPNGYLSFVIGFEFSL